MTEWVGALADWRKIGWSLAAVVCVLTGLLLFTPDALVARTGLLSFRDGNLIWLGLAFLVSLSIFLASLLEAVIGAAKASFDERRLRRNLRTVLRELTPDEKAFLRPYILQQQTSIYAELQDGIAGSLRAKNIVYRAANLSNYEGEFAYNLQPWARKALTADSSLLD